MPEDKLEEKIKKLLQNAEEDYDASSWDRLSRKMDGDADLLASSESDYVPIIKEKLEGYQADVSDEHWSIMSEELDHVQERRRRVITVKILEAAIVILLFMTYVHYSWYSPEVEMNMAYIEDINTANEDPQLLHAALGYIDLQKKRQLNSLIPRPSLSPVQKEVIGRHDLPPIVPQIHYDLIMPPLSQIAFGKVGPHQNLQSKPVSSLAGINHDIKPLESNIDLPYLVMTKTKDAKIYTDQGWTIGLPISYDANFINTDLNLGYLSNQIESGRGGRTYGLSLGYRLKNIELESGIRYAEKSFVPGKLTSYIKTSEASYLENRLDDMVIKQVEIPLIFKFYASSVKNTSLYALMGLSINAIAHNQYEINRSIQPKSRLTNAPTDDIVNLQRLPKGLLDGGPIQDNIFFTAVIGFGIQSSLTDEVNWYIQPKYQHSVTGQINEIVDQVHTLSIESGVKFLF